MFTRPFPISGQYNDANPPKMRLECVNSWSLHAPIQSLEKVRLGASTRDALVMSFLDAKISVVEYDPANNDLRTVSLHHFEVGFRAKSPLE